MEPIQPANCNVTLLRDGNVQCKFAIDDGKTLTAICTPDQTGGIATELLIAAYNSAHFVGPPPPLIAFGPITVNTPRIPVSQLCYGHTDNQEPAIVVQIGHTRIGFAIGVDQMRELGRQLVAASWKSRTSHPSLRTLINDFLAEMRLCTGLIRSQLTLKWQVRATDFNTWLRGRAFRCFSVIHLGPGLKIPDYLAFGECIYCGSKIYSNKPNFRKAPLGAEHIIAEGLGGTLELPEASCQDCESATGAAVERDVLSRTMKAIRIHFGLKKAGSGSFPKTLPLEARIQGQDQKIEIPIADYPIIFAMYAYAPPDLDTTDGTPLLAGAQVVALKYDPQMLFRNYGIESCATEYLDNKMMCRMLAKIGHALAIAELGRDRFKPLLTDLIRFGTNQLDMKYIGGVRRPITSAPGALHSLALGFQKINNTTYVVAHVQLFASNGGPTYAAVIGESLESPISRFKRVFSSKIARMEAKQL